MTTRLDRIEACVNASTRQGDVEIDELETIDILALVAVARAAEAYLADADSKTSYALEKALAPLFAECPQGTGEDHG